MTQDRTGLYVMVFATMIGSCTGSSKISDVEKKVDSLSPVVQTQNVMGGEAPEKFYDINGHRTYLEVDGKPVEVYFPADSTRTVQSDSTSYVEPQLW